jgi:hypothetical protein
VLRKRQWLLAALDRAVGAAIAVMEFGAGQVGCEADAVWHAPFYNSMARRRMMRMIQV